MEPREKPTNEQNNLNSFHKKVTALKRWEEKGGQSAHFVECNPAELTAEDMEAYDRFVSRSMTIEEFQIYRNKVELDNNKSRDAFCAYLANIFPIRIWEKENK